MKNIKLYLLIFGCCFLSNNILHAQKAKFIGKYCSVQKTRLPLNYIEPEKRTYDINTKGTYSSEIDPHQREIFGWTIDADNPTIKGVLSVYGFSVSRPIKKAEKKQKKDKEGKVTKTWTEYSYSANAKGKGNVYIYGESNPFRYKKKDKKKSKYELKKEAEIKAAKEDLADNPFLTSDDLTETETIKVSVDGDLKEEKLPLIKTIRVDQVKKLTTKSHTSETYAHKELTEKIMPQFDDFERNYPNLAYKQTLSKLNYLYGYAPAYYKFFLKRMRSNKHSEFKTWNDACQAVETLFKTVKYNQSIEDTQSKFDPIINYFSSHVNQLSDSDKKAKKMKKAAFHNLVNILYYLDRHDEVITWSEQKLTSKVLDKIAKRSLEKATRKKAHLAFHKMKNCHIETAKEVEEEEIEVEEVEDENLAEGTNK